MNLLKKLFFYYLGLISIFFLGRVTLFIIYFERFKESDINYWLTFLYGLRMDTIIACITLILPLIILCTFPSSKKKWVNRLLKYYFLIALLLFVYLENATLPFFAEYDVRPNFIFVEYLIYPKEVFNTIWSAYKLELIIAFIMLIIVARIFLKQNKWHDFTSILEIPLNRRILMLLPLMLILAIGIRSSFGHRPANVSDAMFSENRVINEITKNTFHSIAYAIYSNQKFENKKLEQYGEMDISEAIQRVSHLLNISATNTSSLLKRLEPTHFPASKPKNLVIFLQESLGAQFVGVTGGMPDITPNFNHYSQQGILFRNLYSNGTRSIRGIAGSVSGIFSVPGKGVIKRNKSQSGFFNIATLLKPYGYHSVFIYGGESHFDNMKGWFLGNGFDEVIDQPKFINPEYTGTWGVSDGDMVLRAHQEFKTMHEQNQPFVAVMFSTSNHSPFDFPDGKFELVPDIAKKSELNAIKYADFAIGEFIKSAQKEDYYQDTVFVILADHNIRVRGDDILPVNLYHIPGMILGGDIKPQRVDRLMTQPDVLATALDLVGKDFTYPIMGHSIFSNKKQDIALMQFNDTYALRVHDKVVILRPDKAAQTFYYKNEQLMPTAHDTELEKNTLAFILTLDHLYQNRLYN